MDYELKYLILGYRKYTNTTQKELAKKLNIPLDIETALEQDYKQPTKHLMNKIKKLTTEFDQNELKNIGRGYKIKDESGSDFKYFLKGLEKEAGLKPQDLKNMTDKECLQTIGSIDINEFVVEK
ncbi:MAG: hypothetical protein ACLQG5_10010 [Methanobacterium sp.]